MKRALTLVAPLWKYELNRIKNAASPRLTPATIRITFSFRETLLSSASTLSAISAISQPPFDPVQKKQASPRYAKSPTKTPRATRGHFLVKRQLCQSAGGRSNKINP